MARHRGHNEGTIYERTYKRKDGTKVTCFVAQLPLDERGKRPSLGTYNTRTEAREALREAAVAKAQGTLVTGKVPTVAQWLDLWLAGRTRISYNTRLQYHVTFEAAKLYIGHIRLDKLTESDIAVMWEKLAAGISADGTSRPPLAATTLETRYIHLNAALRAAVQSRHVPLVYNPCAAAEAKPEKGERKEINPLTEDEVRRLFAATAGEREHALFVTLITTGIRHGEAQALRWQDVDFARQTLSVCGCMHRETGKGWVAGPTKTRKNRMVQLRPHTVALLKVHKARQAEARLKAGPLWQDHGLVFTTDLGNALDQSYIQRKFDRACERAGISRRKIKETRHTYATLALIDNVHPKIVQEALGHSSVTITMDTYSHLVSTLQANSMSHLDRLFS